MQPIPDIESYNLLQQQVQSILNLFIYGGGGGAGYIILKNVFGYLNHKRNNGNGNANTKYATKNDYDILSNTIDTLTKTYEKQSTEVALKLESLMEVKHYIKDIKRVNGNVLNLQDKTQELDVAIEKQKTKCEERYKNLNNQGGG